MGGEARDVGSNGSIGGRGPRSRLRRRPAKGRYERAEVYDVLDATSVCHLGLEVDGGPLVLPMLHQRDGDSVLLHGSQSNRILSAATAAPSVCVAVTIVDGLIVARSAFASSVAYRSAVVFGSARLVTDADEREAALDLLTDGVLPGRVAELRRPTQGELKRTAVLRVAIEEASAKVSEGPPRDEVEDLEGPAWAGVVPLRSSWAEPEPAPDGAVGRGEVPLPPSVHGLTGRRAW